MTGSIQLRHFLHLTRVAGLSAEQAGERVGMSVGEARLTASEDGKGYLSGIEPLDPAATMLGHNKPPEETMSEPVAADELRLLIERIERLEEEKKGIGDDVKDVYGEGKARGFCPKTMRTIVRLRKMDESKRDEAQTLLQLYADALGMQGVLL